MSRLVIVWLVFIALLGVLVLGGGEIGLRLRRQRIAAELPLPPQNDPRFVADRMVRYRNKPGYTFQSGAAHYTINSLGLRGPEITPDKPTGMRRVVVIGGSTVYGAFDDDADTLSQQLENLLRDRLGPTVQVINGGVPGYVALREVALACADLFDLQPDVVVDLDGLNDVYYGSLEEWPAQVATDQLGMLSDGRCPEIPAMVDQTVFPHGLLEYHLWAIYRDQRLALLNLLHIVTPPPPRVVSDRIVALHAESLGLLAHEGRQRGAAVIAALQPLVAVGHKTLSPAEVSAVNHEGYWDVGNWAELAAVMYARFAATTAPAVQSEGGAFVDLSTAFDADTATTYADDAVHYNRLGEQRLAEALEPLIEQRLGAPSAVVTASDR
jgi:lysophospholipase L1-like esterase